MLIGIIGAMEEEVDGLIKSMTIEIKEKKAMMEFNKGKLWNKEVVVVKSGIGKVNAAVCTQILIDDFNVSMVINVGVAGGIQENIYPGDVVIAENLVQYDMDATAFGDKLGQIPRLNTYDFPCDKELITKCKVICEKLTKHNCHVGRIVTGDQFVADLNKIIWLKSEFNAFACEMEGGSIAQVCYLNNIPFVVIRSISDNANNGAHMDFNKFKDIAVENSLEILENLFKII